MKKQPQQSRSKEVVDAVLEAATRILSKIKLKEATTNKIANLAGVGIGSLYDYFPNKQSIAVHLMDRRMNKIIIDLKLFLDEQKSLEMLIENSLEFIENDYFKKRAFLREIFLLAPEHGKMESLYKNRIVATNVLEEFFILKLGKDKAWAKWKSFFLLHTILGFLESYILIEEAEFDIQIMKNDLRQLVSRILEIN